MKKVIFIKSKVKVPYKNKVNKSLKIVSGKRLPILVKIADKVSYKKEISKPTKRVPVVDLKIQKTKVNHLFFAKTNEDAGKYIHVFENSVAIKNVAI